MHFTLKIVSFMVVSFILAYCQSFRETNSREFPCNGWNLSDFENLLGREMKILNDLQCYEIVDTIITADEDESIKWEAKFVSRGDSTLFLAEANWEYPKVIYRITITTSFLQLGGVKVGMTVGEARKFLSEDLPNSPDGYLFVKHLAFPELHLEIDISEISKDNKLQEGVFHLDQIPDSLEVVALIFMRR